MAFRSTDLVFSNRDLDNRLKKFNARVKAAAKTLGESSTTLRDLRVAANGLAMQIPGMIKALSVTSYNGTEVFVPQLSRSSRLLGNLSQATLEYINQTLDTVEQTTITSEMSKIGSTLGVDYRTKVGKEKIRTKVTADSALKKNMNSKDANVSGRWNAIYKAAQLTGSIPLVDYIMDSIVESRYTPEDFAIQVKEVLKRVNQQIEITNDEIASLNKEKMNLTLEISEMEEERSATAGYDLDYSEINKKQTELHEVEERLVSEQKWLEALNEAKADMELYFVNVL